MSVSARCIAIGVLVFFYWAAAFVVAVMNVFAAALQTEVSGWWNLVWLRAPGQRMGWLVFELLEMLPGWEYADILGWPLYTALFITAASLGTGAWLLSVFVSGWWLRRKRPRL